MTRRASSDRFSLTRASTVFFVAARADSPFDGTNGNHLQSQVDELISFDADHPSLGSSSSSTNLQDQSNNVSDFIGTRMLSAISAYFRPYLSTTLSIHSTSPPFRPQIRQGQVISTGMQIPTHRCIALSLVRLDGDDLFSINAQPAPMKSTFYVDPFEMLAPPQPKANNPPTSMLPPASSTPYQHNKNHTSFYYQPPPNFVPSRPPPPVPIVVPRPTLGAQRPLTLENLSLNRFQENTDLLDLGDPGSPPPSPKFDPFG